MKNIIIGTGTIVLALVFLNMGATPPGEIPAPKKDFHGTLVDTDGVKSEVTNISFHGEIFLDGERGKALIAIPFEKIVRLDFGVEDEESKEHPSEIVSVRVSLKDASRVDVQVRKATKWYGKTRFGNLTIKSGNLKSIELRGAGLKRFDCVVIATDHSSVDYNFILENSRLIFDTRGIYKDLKYEKVVML